MRLKVFALKMKWLPTDLINKLVFGIRAVSYGKNLQTYGTIFVRGKGKISLGDRVTITSCREMNPIGGDTKTCFYAKKNSTIIVGSGTGISNSTLVAQDRIEIGDNVLIGANCKLYDHDFHSLNFEERMRSDADGVKSAPIVIKNGAFIGAHCIVLKGVTIGQKAVVGAGSVVTKNIPDGEIWAGNPAKFIRKV